MKQTQTHIYRAKHLVRGSSIGEQPGSVWVAIPDKYAGQPITVLYGSEQMTIKDWRKEAKQFKRFRDKFWTEISGRSQYYTLGYFPFKPNKEV